MGYPIAAKTNFMKKFYKILFLFFLVNTDIFKVLLHNSKIILINAIV